jgi:hypothetical protein
MDFRQTVQPNPRPSTVTAAPTSATADEGKRKTDWSSDDNRRGNKWLNIFTVVMLVGVTVLLCALAFGFGRSNQNDNEFKFVDSSKYQAVFLSNGQVYFGNVDSLNDKYVHMTNIYYLTQADSSTDSNSKSSNYSLVKLGCQQIHDPYDAMTISRDQVTFWENLQNDGKVVKSIKQFKQQNPNGPDCSQVSNQTQADSSAATQGATK